MKFIEDICQKIVSPPKIRYCLYDLGAIFTTSGKRHDFQTLNNKGHKIHASFYQSNNKVIDNVCVIYLHSMNGSRLESTVYVEQILKMGVCFCNFDFTGCGNSEGNSISFGANEKNDLLAIVQKIKQKFGVNRFILWGRSMGSVCAIKYCEMVKDISWLSHRKQVIGIVLDSSFKSFSQLVVEIGHKHSAFPQFLIKVGYLIIKSTLQEMGKFKLQQLQIEDIIGKLQIPALFLASQDDLTVDCQHSKDLYNNYQYHKKQLYFIKGQHNQSRDENYVKKVQQFIGKAIYDEKNIKKQSYSNARFNKMEQFFQRNRKLTLENGQLYRQNNSCYCSIFNSNNSITSLTPQSPTTTNPMFITRRKISQQFLQKVKLNCCLVIDRALVYNTKATNISRTDGLYKMMLIDNEHKWLLYHRMTPCRWKLRPIMLAYTVTMQPENERRPYLLNELATISGYWSSELAPINLSYHVPVGLQQGTSSMQVPEDIGNATVPYPLMLCLPYSSIFHTYNNILGHPRTFMHTYYKLYGCQIADTPFISQDANDSNLFLPDISFQSYPQHICTFTQNQHYFVIYIILNWRKCQLLQLSYH